ncbi:MAG TPA: tetratricopeptide repeat protein [Micropepsaceae bacterium]|nr:tetratricopeptide repeat protein [Micropepsaceae bacterium]
MNESLLQNAARAHQAGNLADAARLYAEVLRANPRHFQALFALGAVYYEAGRFEEAQALVGDSLSVNPRVPEAFFIRGCALLRLKRATEALHCFDQALALKPAFSDAQTNRAMCLMALNRNAQALESLDVALTLDPANVGAWNNRGCVLQNLGRHTEAAAALDKAIAQDPRCVDAFINRGLVRGALKRHTEAATDFERALEIDPDFAYARGNLVFALMQACDWRNFAAEKRAVTDGLKAGKRVIYPFINVALSDSLADQLQCARLWVAQQAPLTSAPLWRGEVYRHDRIRLAYVSADFHAHATPALMAGVFEQHDRNRFERIALSFGHDDKSEMRARVRSAFDRFIDVREKSDVEIATLMRQMEIDIAIDLKGYTKDHRSGIFAFRPAPIQASYLGYPGTIGAPYFDYIIADATVIPDEHRSFYTEQIAYLPDSYQCNDSQRLIAHRAFTRSEVGLPDTGFVFCCFNNNYKIAPDIFGLWMRLLHEIPGSVLWLFEGNPDATRNLKREAEARGIAAGQLVFAPRLSAPDHLARHRLADLFLDTQPYGAHTTASDALWAGLPVLTVLGTTFASRVAASLLRAVGLPEMIVDSLSAYEAMALRLARHPNELAALKAKLARNRDGAPLFDTVRFTRNLESAYISMWQRWQRGEPPQSFSVAESATTPATQIPDAAVAAYVQGCTLANANRLTEALAAFDRAIAIAPHFAESLTNRGAVQLALKNPADALKSFDAALAANPGLAQAWNNRGNALCELGRYDEAVGSYDRVLAARPNLFEPLLNRSNALLAARRIDEALASYDRALAAKPDSTDALKGRANALFEHKRFEEAIAGYQAVLARDSGHAYTQGDLAFAKLQNCDWRKWEEDRNDIIAAVRIGKRVVNPFEFLALSSDPQDQKQCAALWVADKHPPSPAPIPRSTYAREKIRIAYLSADFRNHAVAHAMAGVFEHHDRSRFETIAVGWGPDEASDMRSRLRSAFAQFIGVDRDSDSQVAQRLRDMDIDIAIDLMGFTAECRPGILAARAAPIQVNYLGFPGTMNAPYMDYLVADAIVIPESEQHHYGETIIRLPDTLFPVDSKRRIGATPSRRDAGLPETGFVFASFNNSYKFSPTLFDVWMRLLKRIEASVLWLSGVNQTAARNLAREARNRGVDPDRLIFASFVPKPEDHLARLGLADLFLDTLPYNAHATAADALLAGLPVLTCKGRTFAGRVAASLLHAAGLPELVTESLDAYEALALRLATDSAMLGRLKNTLAANRKTHPLFDTARFTRHLEAAYIEMLARCPIS